MKELINAALTTLMVKLRGFGVVTAHTWKIVVMTPVHPVRASSVVRQTIGTRIALDGHKRNLAKSKLKYTDILRTEIY